MTSHMKRSLLLLPVAALIALGSTNLNLEGYALSASKWPTSTVTYYVNSQSKWVSESAATSAVQVAAQVWREQTQANIELVYGGYTSGSSLTLNYKNEVFFRDGTHDTVSNAIAETRTWVDSKGNRLDSDIVFYEGAYTWFAFSGCSKGLYIENVGVHELGHMLGLGHSEVSAAAMYYKASYCSQKALVLDPDDIAGIEAQYPPVGNVAPPAAPSQLAAAVNGSNPTSSLVLSWQDNAGDEKGFRVERSLNGSSFSQIAQVGTNVKSYTDSGLASGTTYYYRVAAYNDGGASAFSNTASGQTQAEAETNTAPVVSTTNPGDGASYPENVAISFSGSAVDTQDGDLTSKLKWTSSLSGNIGTGGSFSKTLAAGTHVITAEVTDSGGLSGSKSVTMTVTVSEPAPAGATLTASGYKVKGNQKADLAWSGLSSTSVDVYRSGSKVATVSNNGKWTDNIDRKGNGVYTYRVCASGSSTCTNEATVSF
jgi:hypothetical protein